jgi:hypothetical protein
MRRPFKNFLAFSLSAIILLSGCKKQEPFSAQTSAPTGTTVVTTVNSYSWQSVASGFMMIKLDSQKVYYTETGWLQDRLKIEISEQGLNAFKTLPYVLYNKISQDTTTLFFTVNPLYDDLGDQYGPAVVFARLNAGIDFTKKADVKTHFRR